METETELLDAIRATYDAVAADYAEQFRTELSSKALDRAVLTAFAELVLTGRGGRVADLGCGPGNATAHLAALGVDVIGIDLSPQMIGVARKAHPGVPFEVGSMKALDLPDASLGGAVSMFSIVNIPPDRLPEVLGEWRRVLAPGGHLLLVFLSGNESRHITEWLGHEVSLDFHRYPPDDVAKALELAGFVVDARIFREPDMIWEHTQRAFLMAHKPSN